MKTYMAKASDPKVASRRWYLVDAKGQVLGRLAARVATILRGKHKAIYTPHVDTGDVVVVINSQMVRVTGRKFQEKQYLRFSGYPGGLKSTSFEVMQKTKPNDIIRLAVKRMLPAGPLYRDMMKKLKIYPGTTHPHAKVELVNLEIK
jgi:large subunit ribosomal protein L13